MSTKYANEFDMPEDMFAGSANMDFAGMYLEASEEEETQTTTLAQQRIANRELGGTHYRSMQSLVKKAGVAYPPTTGARVAFASSVEAVFSYENPPAPGTSGTVVTVRTASGDLNHHEGKVFVRWDNGVMLPTYAEHLVVGTGAPRIADAVRRRVSSLGDLSDFLKVASDTLVHKATKDLWAMRQDGSSFVLERLFNETGDPLKV